MSTIKTATNLHINKGQARGPHAHLISSALILHVHTLINPHVFPHTNSVAEARTVFSCVQSHLQQPRYLGMFSAPMIRHAQTSCLFSALLVNALGDYLQNFIRAGTCTGSFCRLAFILIFCSFATCNTPPEFAHTFYITLGLSFVPLLGIINVVLSNVKRVR